MADRNLVRIEPVALSQLIASVYGALKVETAGSLAGEVNEGRRKNYTV